MTRPSMIETRATTSPVRERIVSWMEITSEYEISSQSTNGEGDGFESLDLGDQMFRF